MIPLSIKNDKIIIKINKYLYRESSLDKGLEEAEDFIKPVRKTRDYISLEASIKDKKNVLEWLNYLLYLNRTA